MSGVGAEPDPRLQRPLPLPDPDTAPFWDAAAAGRLSLPVCEDCGRAALPPRRRCAGCGGFRLAWRDIEGRGTVESFAVARMNLVRGYEAPYLVAWVRLDAHPEVRLNCNLVDCAIEQAQIGLPVELCFEPRAEGLAVPQFRPAGAAAP